jgi:hypothetical protein
VDLLMFGQRSPVVVGLAAHVTDDAGLFVQLAVAVDQSADGRREVALPALVNLG